MAALCVVILVREAYLSGLTKRKEENRGSARTSRLDRACGRTFDHHGCARPRQEARREMTQGAGDLYRFQNNFHVGSRQRRDRDRPDRRQRRRLVLGPDQERFKQPIRYVIYSHDHADHIAGGDVFKKAGVTVIAHEMPSARSSGSGGRRQCPTSPSPTRWSSSSAARRWS
jgi:Metallo-beta-lactamase superfamily